MSELNNYEKLASVNVGDKIEKKNGLSYLSWAWAVDQLLRHDPAASWSYGEPVRFGDTVMVSCTVVAFGKPMTMQLPVMNHRNQAIANPDAFAVNTAMQRCLVKAIALHGLGLYIYAGEDLPYEEKPEQPVKEAFKSEPASAWDKLDADTQEWMVNEAMAVTVLTTDGDIEGAYQHLESLKLDDEFKTAFWSRLDATQRSSIKAYSAIIHAKDLDALEKAWKAVPKHSLKSLEAAKDRRKDELTMKEAA